jgi:hypothetical protein
MKHQHRSKRKSKVPHRVVDIKVEMSEKHLAAMGALVLAFNEAEAALDRLFFVVTQLPEAVQIEISTRIGNAEKTNIIKKGCAEFFAQSELEQLQEVLGEGMFGTLKDYRDGVVHARHINAITGIGVKLDRSATVFNYLVRRDALDAAYDLLVVIRRELDEAIQLVEGAKAMKLLAPPDSNRLQLEAELMASRSRFGQCQKERRALPKIPEFPSEEELRVAELQAQQARTAELMSRYQFWTFPQYRRQFSPALWNYIQNTPLPLLDEDK